MKPYFETELGKLYHGDCLELMGSLSPLTIDMIVTDPPYGTKTDQRETYMVGEFSNIMPLALPAFYRILKKDGAFYCFTSWTMMSDWLLRFQQYFKMKNLIIWDKQRHSGCYSAQSWQFTWEGIFFGLKGKRGVREYQPDVLHSTENGNRIAMQKPVDIIERLLLASTDEGDVVLDPFVGSGSTAIACERQKRKWIAVEISEEFCQLDVKRIKAEVQQGKLWASNNRLHLTPKSGGKNRTETSSFIAPLFGASEA